MTHTQGPGLSETPIKRTERKYEAFMARKETGDFSHLRRPVTPEYIARKEMLFMRRADQLSRKRGFTPSIGKAKK